MKTLIATIIALLGALPALAVEGSDSTLSPAETGSPQALVEANLRYYSGANNAEKNFAKVLDGLSPECQFAFFADRENQQFMTLPAEKFIDMVKAQERGFWEVPLETSVSKFGKLATAQQTYEIRLEPEGEAVMRGVNLYTLAFYKDRWWITHVTWMPESDDFHLPD